MGSAVPSGDPPPADSADDCIPPDNRSSGNAQQHVQNPDRISSLPDDILINILSLMTVSEALVTDVLSTRWRHLWESVEHLILDMHTFAMQVPPNEDNHGNLDFWNSEAIKFVRKVNKLLSHHKGNKLKEFKVEFPLSSAHASELDRWVDFAVASHAETLTLSLCYKHGHGRVAPDDTEAYVFPLKQFSDVASCQLHVLSLYKCILKAVPANLNGFSHLHSLSLSHVWVGDKVLVCIMSSCNALHNLYLRACHKLIDLRASHAQLVTLEVYWCKRLRSISIYAEKMETFSYKGRRADIEFGCVPVLCELNARYGGTWKHTLALLDKIPNKLKMMTLQCPSRCQVSRVLQGIGRFVVLTEITFCVRSWKKSIRIVALVLQAAPSVQTLNLEVHGNQRPLKMLKIRWPMNFTAASLKTIRIEGFSGEPELVQLLLFLLTRSSVLKTLLINTHQVRHQGLGISESEKSKDAMRCNYGREVAQTHVAPNVPSTVKFSIM